MKLYKYHSYDEYLGVQIEASQCKFSNSFYDPVSIGLLVEYLLSVLLRVEKGICHGVRDGKEVESFITEFKKRGKDVKVIGTGVNPETAKIKNCIAFDFNKVKDDWIGAFDFIYSNSFDHSYNPEHTLDQWMSCLSQEGFCFIEWTPAHESEGLSARDPFQVSLDEYIKLIERKYTLVDILNNDVNIDQGKTHRSDRSFLVITHRKDKV